MSKTLTIYISNEQYDWLEEMAKAADRSKSYVVQQLIDTVRPKGMAK